MTPWTTLIEARALAALPTDDVLIVDCRFDLADPAKGERDYREGHVPGAAYAHLDRDLSDLSRQREGLGRHPLPSGRTFSAALSRWGWRPGQQVVCYDAANGALAAARLWWLLRLAGIREAAVLDGGYAAWLAAGLPVESGAAFEAARLSEANESGEGRESGVAKREAARVDVHFDAGQYLVEHARLLADPRRVLIDARAAPRYRGEVEPIDPVGGHVPGALNRPFSDNLGADGRFKPADALRREFIDLLGTHAPQDAMHMCGSGVTACHNLLAMEHAGLVGSRLYAPSWSGWVSDPARPVARG